MVGITPAMPTGSSLRYMMDVFPERAFDVGIAEQHAVTLAAGMAAEGLVPFCNIYSTFLQRGYDQVIHDVALQKLPVIFCLDRAGIVGQDGPTHHGLFDMAYLRCIPNLVIFAPMNEVELRNILFTAQEGVDFPLAIRYPRGRGVIRDWQQPFEKIPIGVSQELKRGSRIAVLSIGTIGNAVSEALRQLGQPGEVGHYNMRFVKPLDRKMLRFIFEHYEQLITVEDGCIAGGFGTAVLEYAGEMQYKQPVKILGVEDRFVEHGTVEQLHELAGIGPVAIREQLNKLINA